MKNIYLPLAEEGWRIVALEPDCKLTFRDEYLSLMPRPKAACFAEAVGTIEEYLASRLPVDRAAHQKVSDFEKIPLFGLAIIGIFSKCM